MHIAMDQLRTFCWKDRATVPCLDGMPQNYEDFHDKVTCDVCRAGYESYVRHECVICPRCNAAYQPGFRLTKCVVCGGICCPNCNHNHLWHRILDCAGAGGNATC